MRTTPHSRPSQPPFWLVILLAALAGALVPIAAAWAAAPHARPPTTTWVLVVIIGTDGEYEVWPGATDWLLGRSSPSFRTLAACDTARRQLLTRATEPITYTLDGQTLSLAITAADIRRVACLSVPEA